MDAASDIKDWMLRAVIERDENDEEMLAIADEFRFDDSEKDLNEVFGAKGGCVADLNHHNPASCTQQSPLVFFATNILHPHFSSEGRASEPSNQQISFHPRASHMD